MAIYTEQIFIVLSRSIRTVAVCRSGDVFLSGPVLVLKMNRIMGVLP